MRLTGHSKSPSVCLFPGDLGFKDIEVPSDNEPTRCSLLLKQDAQGAQASTTHLFFLKAGFGMAVGHMARAVLPLGLNYGAQEMMSTGFILPF